MYTLVQFGHLGHTANRSAADIFEGGVSSNRFSSCTSPSVLHGHLDRLLVSLLVHQHLQDRTNITSTYTREDVTLNWFFPSALAKPSTSLSTTLPEYKKKPFLHHLHHQLHIYYLKQFFVWHRTLCWCKIPDIVKPQIYVKKLYYKSPLLGWIEWSSFSNHMIVFYYICTLKV